MMSNTMTDTVSAERLALAQRNVYRYAVDPHVKAAMVVGSVAHGMADDSSDIDTTLFYDEPMGQAQYDSIVARARNSGGDLYYGTPRDGFAIYEYIDGIRCDFGYSTIAEAEKPMQAMLDQPDTDSNKQVVISGFVSGIALYGHSWVEGWQAKLRNYPSGLAEALVRKYLRFHPRWVLDKLGLERNESIYVAELLLESEENIFGILCGLNRLYHPGKVKGIAWSLAQMSIKPPQLLERAERAWKVDQREAVGIVSGLIDETLALVETHMPSVSTERTRTVLAMILRK